MPTIFFITLENHANKFTFLMTKSIIHSLVVSRLIYYCSLLFDLRLKLMLKLEMIHPRAPFITEVLFNSFNIALMRLLGWLNCRYLCRYILLCITQKVIYLRSPEYLADMIISRARRKCF